MPDQQAVADSPITGEWGMGADSSSDNVWVTSKIVKYNKHTVYKCVARDTYSDNIACFDVSIDCVNGICNCVHMIGDAKAQLLPCRVFSECFLRGDVDPDWDYILKGIIFGFKVINKTVLPSMW